MQKSFTLKNSEEHKSSTEDYQKRCLPYHCIELHGKDIAILMDFFWFTNLVEIFYDLILRVNKA